jgi:hypothetical protein
VTKTLKINVDEEVLRWTRFCAAKGKLSVSKFVGQIIERERTGKAQPFWLSREDSKELSAKGPDDAENRLMVPDEANDRRR